MSQVEEVLDSVVNPTSKKQGYINLGIVSMLCIALAVPLFNRVSHAEADAKKTKDTVQTIEKGISEMTGYLKVLAEMRRAELEGKKIIIYDTLTIVDTVFVDYDEDSL